MNNDVLISIVLPIYNVENYLNDCVESVIKQTYVNLEIILVDDGSTDNSGEMCDVWKKKDKRIIVIHKKNGGLSDARNAGLKIAKGSYIAFIDSDDVIDETFIETLYTSIRETKAQIACCNFSCFTDKINKENDYNEKNKYELLTGKKLVSAIYCGNYSNISFVAWNKLYKISLFREYNIDYPKGKVHEDTFTTYKLLYFAQSVVIENRNLYWYRLRGGSITNTNINEKRCIDRVEALYSNVIFFRDKNESLLYKQALNMFYKLMINTYKEVEREAENSDVQVSIEFLMDTYKNVWKANNNDFGLIKVLVYRLFIYMPKIIARIMK